MSTSAHTSLMMHPSSCLFFGPFYAVCLVFSSGRWAGLRAGVLFGPSRIRPSEWLSSHACEKSIVKGTFWFFFLGFRVVLCYYNNLDSTISPLAHLIALLSLSIFISYSLHWHYTQNHCAQLESDIETVTDGHYSSGRWQNVNGDAITKTVCKRLCFTY